MTDIPFVIKINMILIIFHYRHTCLNILLQYHIFASIICKLFRGCLIIKSIVWPPLNLCNMNHCWFLFQFRLPKLFLYTYKNYDAFAWKHNNVTSFLVGYNNNNERMKAGFFVMFFFVLICDDFFRLFQGNKYGTNTNWQSGNCEKLN